MHIRTWVTREKTRPANLHADVPVPSLSLHSHHLVAQALASMGTRIHRAVKNCIISKIYSVTRLLYPFRIWNKPNQNSFGRREDFLKSWAEANEHFVMGSSGAGFHLTLSTCCGLQNLSFCEWNPSKHLVEPLNIHDKTCGVNCSWSAEEGKHWEVHLNNTHICKIIRRHPGSTDARTELLC